jgi:GTPase SAR1 family protein
MCIIAYKMKVYIPIVIQGEAGIGKTALLRHLIEHVYQYKFISHAINAGITEKELKKKIDDAKI